MLCAVWERGGDVGGEAEAENRRTLLTNVRIAEGVLGVNGDAGTSLHHQVTQAPAAEQPQKAQHPPRHDAADAERFASLPRTRWRVSLFSLYQKIKSAADFCCLLARFLLHFGGSSHEIAR